MQTTIAKFQGARYVAPWMNIRGQGSNLQEAQGLFFGTGNPDIEFQPMIGTNQGPTTAFSTTVEARQWDNVVNSFLLMEKMHDNQKFPLLLSPFELAQGMTFTTRIFTSNLDPPEEAPEHVPAPFSTTSWSETKTVLKLVHRSVKFSQHELKTVKGQQDYKVHLENLGLMFLRDVHACILRKFARQSTVLTALSNMYPPSAGVNRDLMHNVIRSFGQLNCEPTGLDTLVNNIKQIGTLNNVEYDTCVVPYGSLSNLALNPNNFILTETAVTLARDLARMADINHPAKVPTHIFQNNMSVFQYQRTAEQMQNPRNDPLANSAVVATYHPFGHDAVYIPGSRDIQIVSTATGGWEMLKFEEAVEWLGLTRTMPIVEIETMPAAVDYPTITNCAHFGQSADFKGSTNTFAHIVANLKGTFQNIAGLAEYAVKKRIGMLASISSSMSSSAAGESPWTVDGELSSSANGWLKTILQNVNVKTWPCSSEIENWIGASDLDKLYLAIFMMLPCDVESVKLHLARGIDFPFEVAAVRPWIELETSNAIFCKRGRETAVTYCLPPWTFIGRDNRIEMLDMKFGFWRECHIERPANILVAEHAFVNRVVKGMDTQWMGCDSAEYKRDPLMYCDRGSVYPVIVGPIDSGQIYPALAPILQWGGMNTSEGSLSSNRSFRDSHEVWGKHGMLEKMSDVWKHKPTASVTLWKGDEIQKDTIPRIASLGTTQQRVVEVGMNRDKQVPIRIKPGPLIHNHGHLKKLDSPEWVGSLCGFAQSQIATPGVFF